LVEPLDDWVPVQPTMEEEAVGRIVLPANMAEDASSASIVLAIGSGVDPAGRCRARDLGQDGRIARRLEAQAAAARRRPRSRRDPERSRSNGDGRSVGKCRQLTVKALFCPLPRDRAVEVYVPGGSCLTNVCGPRQGSSTGTCAKESRSEVVLIGPPAGTRLGRAWGDGDRGGTAAIA
jgi:hypothetical protein